MGGAHNYRNSNHPHHALILVNQFASSGKAQWVALSRPNPPMARRPVKCVSPSRQGPAASLPQETLFVMIENKDQFTGKTGLDSALIATVMRQATAAAAKQTLPLFRTHLTVENKHKLGFDPVTEADKAAERAIRETISRAFPEHGIIGEEHGSKETSSEFTWIIDPVDGTRSFITGVPLWGTLIGLYHQGRPIAGIMSQPFIGETFLAVSDMAIYEHGDTRSALATSGETDLARARVFTTTPALFDTGHKDAVWQAIGDAALLTRYGTDCYAYCLIAAGMADLVVEPGLHIYDIAALIPIIEQAGGAVSTWDGGSPEQGGDIVAAASKQLLAETLDVIAAARR